MHVNVLSFDFSYTILFLWRQRSVFVWSDFFCLFFKLFKTAQWFVFMLSAYSIYHFSTRLLVIHVHM